MVESITTTSTNTELNTGDVITIKVTFTEPLAVTGNPKIALNFGGKKATFSTSENGDKTMVFTYTIVAGDDVKQLDVMHDGITLNGGTISDKFGNDGNLHYNMGKSDIASKAVKVDAAAPNVEIASLLLNPATMAW